MIILDVDLIYDKYDEWVKKKEKVALDEIACEINNLYTDASRDTLQQLAIQIDENINFYRGNHDIVFDNGIGRYKNREQTPYNKHIPKRFTNYVGTEVDAVVSLLTRSKENFQVVENSNNAIDRNKARIGEAILEGNYFLNNELFNKHLFVKIAVLCGTAYRKDFFDYSIKYKDSKGRTIIGDTATKILSPLQIIPDYQDGIRDIDDGRYVLEFGFYPISSVKSMYSKKEKGYTGFTDKIKEDSSVNIQLDYLQKLKNPEYDENSDLKKYTIVQEVYIKPNEKHEKGLMIVCTNKEVLYIDENKIYNQFGGRFWTPYTMFRYIRDIFRHHGTSLAEQIIPLNKAINRIDTLVEINRATMVSPKFFYPVGSLTPEQVITGRPGQAIPYKPVGDKPYFEYGKPLDQSVMIERDRILQDLTKISKSNEVLQGIRPQGVSTTSGLNMLLEQAYSQFNTTSFELENALSTAYTKVLNLKRYNYDESREDYFNRIKALNSNLTKVAINDFFIGKDLGNNIDVRVEPGSTRPKSSVMEKQTINELAQLGSFGTLDPLQNPLGNKFFLNKMGVGDFNTPTNKDVTRAEWENDLIRNAKYDEVRVMPIDNNILHYKVLQEEIKKPDFYDNNNEEVATYYWKHLCEHFQAMMPEEYQMAGITQAQINELDNMSINLGVIGQDELMMKRMPPEQLAMMEQQNAMVGQDPNSQTVPMQEGQMPNDSIQMSMGQGDINSSEMM